MRRTPKTWESVMRNFLSLAFGTIVTIIFASWLIYMGLFFLAATHMILVMIGMEFLPSANTRQRMAIRRIIQFFCAMVCLILSSGFIRERDDAIFIIVPFVFWTFSLVIASRAVHSWGQLIDDLRSGSDR